MSITKIIFPFFLLFTLHGYTQNNIEIITEQKGVSLRGLSIPNEKVIWASGSKGSIAKSVDGGLHFEWMQVKGFEQRDFRAIHAFDANNAIIVAVSSPGIILKTKDGGISWNIVLDIADSTVFLDAIDFIDSTNGYIVGDPMADSPYPFLLNTNDKGASWQEVSIDYFKAALVKGESFFASSSTNMAHSKDGLYMVTGGIATRLWINGSPTAIPIIKGSTSTGANSISISPDGRKICIVGGDFSNDKLSSMNAFLLSRTNSQQNTWTAPKINKPPFGYKSCVQFINNLQLVACGTSGVDFSKDGGSNWQKISDQSFHVLKVQPTTHFVFFAGSGGRIGRYKFVAN